MELKEWFIVRRHLIKPIKPRSSLTKTALKVTVVPPIKYKGAGTFRTSEDKLATAQW